MAHADGITVGAFCVEGVKGADVANSRRDVVDGHWDTKTYTYDAPASGASTATVVVFGKAVSIDPKTLPTCENAKKVAADNGIAVILEGHLQHLALRLNHLTRLGVNSYLVEPSGFVATLGRVKSGLSKVGGGVIDLAGSKAWIENPTQLNILGDAMTGTLRIESWDRVLKGALFHTSAGDEINLSLHANAAGNTTFDVDTASGITTLWKGDLSAINVDLKDITIDGELGAFKTTNCKIDQIDLIVDKGQARLTFSGASGKATTGSVGNNKFGAQLGALAITWKRADTAATESEVDIKVGRLAFRDLGLKSDDVKMYLSGAQLLAGGANADFAALDASSVKGAVRFTSSRESAIGFVLPNGSIPAAVFEIDGTPSSLDVKGGLSATKLTLGGAGFSAPFPMTFEKKPADSEIQIPINVHVPTLSGGFDLKNDSGAVMLTAALKRLDVSGSIYIDVTDVSKSRVEIPATQFAFDLSTVASITPYLAGTKPDLAQLGVQATNPDDVVVNRAGATGSIDITTPTLILGAPTLAIGQDGKAGHVTVALKADGSATFRYDLATAKAHVVEGTFTLSNLHVNSPDADFVADLGGILVERPDLQLQNLSIVLKKSETTGHINGKGFSFNGAGVRSAPGSGVAFQGAFSAPLSIDEIEGLASIDDKGVKLTELSLGPVGFGVVATRTDIGSGITLKNASLQITADRIRNLNGQPPGAPLSDGTYLTNLRVRAGGSLALSGNISLANAPRIHDLDITVSGRTDKLDGGGGATLDGFAGDVKTDISTGFHCSGDGVLAVPIKTYLATGPSALAVSVKSGDVIAKGSFAALGADATSTAAKSCDSDHMSYDKDPVYGSMTGLCPTWSNPFRTCEWKTIIVPAVHIGYRIKLSVFALHATVAMSNPRVTMHGGGVTVCNVGPMTLVAPAILADYVPQLDDNGIIAQAVNVVVEGVAVTTESTIATGLLNGVGLLVNDPLLSAAGSTQCILKGSYDAN